MKTAKLSAAQTNVLRALGVDVTVDLLIPAKRGPGCYTKCETCYYQAWVIDEKLKDNVNQVGARSVCRTRFPYISCESYMVDHRPTDEEIID